MCTCAALEAADETMCMDLLLPHAHLQVLSDPEQAAAKAIIKQAVLHVARMRLCGV